jgi:hypothetical protein
MPQSERSAFSGDLTSARARFRDVVSVYLRCADAADLNRQSFGLSATLAAYYGLTDLHDRIDKEISDDRRAVELRLALRICERPGKAKARAR